MDGLCTAEGVEQRKDQMQSQRGFGKKIAKSMLDGAPLLASGARAAAQIRLRIACVTLTAPVATDTRRRALRVCTQSEVFVLNAPKTHWFAGSTGSAGTSTASESAPSIECSAGSCPVRRHRWSTAARSLSLPAHCAGLNVALTIRHQPYSVALSASAVAPAVCSNRTGQAD